MFCAVNNIIFFPFSETVQVLHNDASKLHHYEVNVLTSNGWMEIGLGKGSLLEWGSFLRFINLSIKG